MSKSHRSFDEQIVTRIAFLLAEREQESLSDGVQHARALLSQAHQAYRATGVPHGATNAGFLLWMIDRALGRPYGNAHTRFLIWLLESAVDEES